MVAVSRRSVVLLGVWGLLVGGGMPGDTSDFRKAKPLGQPSCPAGWALDRVRAECHRCPPGYDRVAFAPDFMGCWSRAGWTHSRPQKEKAARGLIGTECPAGQFPHIDPLCLTCPRTCYSCPPGAIRTGESITSPRGCALPVPPQPAALRVRTACPTGAFRDLGRGDCWSCEGWIRTAAPVTTDQACTRDLTGILGVDPGAICTGLLGAIDSGGKMAAETEAALNALMSPVLKPVSDAMNAVTRQFRTPAEFERLLSRISAPLRADPRFRDELPDLASRLVNGRDRLLNLLVDPAVMCGGDLARVGRELGALDLWPRAWRAERRPDPLAFNVLRPSFAPVTLDTPSADAPQPYVVYAFEGSLNTGYVFGMVGTLSILLDGRGPLASLVSVGPSASPPVAGTGGLGFTVLFFPSAVLSDFVAINSLGVQLNVELGDLIVKTLMGEGALAKRQVDRFPTDVDFVVSIDPTLKSDGGFPVGFGFSISLKGKFRRPVTNERVSAASDMTALTNNAGWKSKGGAAQVALSVLKKLNLSGDYTWVVKSLRTF